MPEKEIRPRSGRSGAKAIAIDNRARMAKIRLLLILFILSCAGLAIVLNVLLSR